MYTAISMQALSEYIPYSFLRRALVDEIPDTALELERVRKAVPPTVAFASEIMTLACESEHSSSF